MEQPFGDLLDQERDRRQEHDQRRCRSPARLPAEGGRTLEHEPREQDAEAHGEGQRHVGEVRSGRCARAHRRAHADRRTRVGNPARARRPALASIRGRGREPREPLPHLLEWWQMATQARTYNRRMAGEKSIAENRKARFDYQLLERFEAGLVLTGSEVKSLREGRVSLLRPTPTCAKVRPGWWAFTSTRTTRRAPRTTSRSVIASCCCTGESSTRCTGRCARRG